MRILLKKDIEIKQWSSRNLLLLVLGQKSQQSLNLLNRSTTEPVCCEAVRLFLCTCCSGQMSFYWHPDTLLTLPGCCVSESSRCPGVTCLRLCVLHIGLLWPYAVTPAVTCIALTVLWSLAGL
ncbi:hypothetical protein ElyMa_005677500 [Elysia marginata]|uniref:Uncharacterized protein n=1 Tax=Elysia marginata TaxID=1093978 RepID=A0AAV4FG13_9GAST|nr:hypothetical protein ElyMa_005677500 [Elysia marginata]